ncbi:MAG TPA: alpha/beta hydrolase, partial [Oligoflexia bacterium]|nr:alpha/beta hydrolase [Oligoflexia bacterium]
MSRLIMRAAHRALMAGGFNLRQFKHLGSDVHYIEGGNQSGPLCLVLPGMGDNFSNWTHFLLKYSKKMRLFSLDFPGYTGLSTRATEGDSLTFDEQLRVAEKFADLITESAKSPIQYVVGNSLGGWQAVKLANRAPNQINNLVLVNPAGYFLSEEEAAKTRDVYEIRNHEDFRRLMKLFWHKVPAYFYPFSLLGLYQFMKGPELTKVVYSVERHHFLNHELSKIQQPVHLIWGESDGLFPISLANEFRRQVARLDFYPVKKAGHMPQLERPLHFFQIIDTILNRTHS